MKAWLKIAQISFGVFVLIFVAVFFHRPFDHFLARNVSGSFVLSLLPISALSFLVYAHLRWGLGKLSLTADRFIPKHPRAITSASMKWYRSKNFWLHLAAIVILRMYVSSIVRGGYLSLLLDRDLYSESLLNDEFAPYFLFIGFCITMNIIRKNPCE